MADPKKEKFWKYYQAAWLSIFDEMSGRLLMYGFAPKSNDGKFEIGNSHGEVYLYPNDRTALAARLYMAEIYPSYTGNLLIKLTTLGRKELVEIDRHIQASLKPMAFGKEEKTKEGRFTREYFFFREERPNNPIDMGQKLLDTAQKWFLTLNENF